ncbi:Multicopper oxidase [Legionella lansingensis]|uniref:Multicopper oxidase n=1 Tax=Legionella lansingensis TaxID=45067 RepID=A0A0W0VPW0_9GAMM|nr:multicopper oxidase family protein [Legionella lansingensis]KTD22145.1 Multicopper oxidase [Legionella lansingensis]SNV54484.1 Multicopper oxidase [Legionella lansingensis]
MQRLQTFERRNYLFLFFFSFALIIFCFDSPAEQKTPSPKTIIEVTDTQFQLNEQGKAAKAFNLRFIKPDGSISKEGYFGTKGDLFNVTVVNKSAEPITIHWHGLIVPNDQDGVPYVTQTPIKPGESHPYKFKLLQSGTYWMHSHVGFQEQQLLAAPFIIYKPGEQNKEQEVILFLEDFTYADPNILFQKLRSAKMPAMTMSKSMNMNGKADFNDIDYDAFLTNRTTLKKPEIKTVSAGKTIRLRIINGSASTNFQINLGNIAGTLIAVDGEDVQPITAKTFPIGIANRLDIILTIPKQGGFFPILAQAEGTNKQTGLILVTGIMPIPQLSSIAAQSIGRIDYYQLEKQLHAIRPLTKKPVTVSLSYSLDGNMQGYQWMLNGQSYPKITPKTIKQGDRVEMVFTNTTQMSHPMHLHGHVFQVTEIDGIKLPNGAMRDTVLVQPNSTVKIQFDADNPGIWLNHCHNLYHFIAGMGTTVEYIGYPKPSFYLEFIGAGKK